MFQNGPIQKFAAVCGTGHIASDSLDQGTEPGTHPQVPKLCKVCSAPIFMACSSSGCDAPIHGKLSYPNVISVTERRADWFCHRCGVPYVWATPDQHREWALNQIRFNDGLSDDDQDDLLEMVAVLSDPSEDDRRQTYRSFKDRVTSLGDTAESLQPLVRLFRMLTLGE